MAILNLAIPPRNPGPLGRVLRAIGHELMMCQQERSAVPEEYDAEEYEKGVVLEMDGFLGAAFVSCQAYVSSVVAMAGYLDEASGLPNRIPKHELLQMESIVVKNTDLSWVQGVDFVANYFKHRDDWTPDWLGMEKRDMRTAAAMRALGGSPFRYDNLLVASDVLGFTDYEFLEVIAHDLAGWGASVLNRMRLRVNGAHREERPA